MASRDASLAADFEIGSVSKGMTGLLYADALSRGEIGPDTNSRLIVEIAFGTIWYRLLARHAPLNRRFADQLTDALLALATPSSEHDP